MAVDWRRIARLGSPDGESAVATSMVPPGVPGRSERDFLPTLRSGGGADAARGRRLSGRRRLPGGHDADERRVVRRGDRRRGPSRARHRARVRDDGLRAVLRSARGRPAGDLVAQLDRRLPGAERLPRRPARERLDERLRPLDLRRVRCGDRRRGGRRRRRGRGGRVRPGRDHRPAGRAGRPGRLRHGLGAVADGLLGAGQNGLGIIRMAGLAWAD